MSETERFYAWLDSMKPKPVDAKEKKRMAAAIRFDLEETARRGLSIEDRKKVLCELYGELGTLELSPARIKSGNYGG